MMNRSWQPLIEALRVEVQVLTELVTCSHSARGPLSHLDVPAVETWATEHRALLARLNRCSEQRAKAQQACLPASVRGVAGPGPIAEAITLHALSQRAPAAVGDELRQHRDTLRALRDELSFVSRRNDVLIAQVLEFTTQLGESLVAANEDNSYNAGGHPNDSSTTGALYRRAL